MNPIPRDPLPDATLALLRDPYRYIARRCRALGADVFRTRLLLKETLCMSGPEAAKLFYRTDLFERAGAAPLRLQQSLFGPGGVQTLDGEAHRCRKQLFMSMMTPIAIERLQYLFTAHWERDLPNWTGTTEVDLYRRMQRILMTAVCEWAGVPLPKRDVTRRTRQIVALFDGAGAVGPRHWRSRLSRRHADRWIARIVERLRGGAAEVPRRSPLDAIASFRDVDGECLPPSVAAVELLNLVRPTVAVAVYVVFIAHALAMYPQCREPLRGATDGLLNAFAQEVRRHYPFFPAVVARVKTHFTWGEYEFPAGARVLLDLYGTDHDPRVWKMPDEFAPQRFLAWSADPYTLIPQGGGDHHLQHRCPGEWITVALMKTAIAMLVDRIDYDVAGHRLDLNFRRLPALPRARFVLRRVRLRGSALPLRPRAPS